jgi:hypothetical protein
LGIFVYQPADPATTSDWATLFFPDTYLIAMSCCGLPVQVLVVAPCGVRYPSAKVETLTIVTEFDVPGNIFPGVFAGGVDGAIDPFNFDSGVERLGESVVEAHSGGAGRPSHSRKVVGYAVADHLRTTLIIEALAAALLTRKPPRSHLPQRLCRALR